MLSSIVEQSRSLWISEGTGTRNLTLPLNLLAKIIGDLDEPADLARACRTCRMLHYMCLPKLYSNVILRSYDHVRYSEETFFPEGVGGASPFTMGLNTLVTREVTPYVQRFTLTGTMADQVSDEAAQMGRIPDSTMLLGSLVRVCLDRMDNIKDFSWMLTSKMLPTVWEALSRKTNLQKLTVRMPSKRDPLPISIAPPLPNLTHLHVRDIDPACFPDNFSELLYHSRKLQHLKMHFSPRMRRESDPSISLDAFFGKVKVSDYRMPLKSLALQNFYAAAGGDFADFHDYSVIEEMTLIDSSIGADNAANLNFVNHLPRRMPEFRNVKKLRGNKASVVHSRGLPIMLKTIHTYHLISGRALKEEPWPSPSTTSRSSSQQLSSESPALSTPSRSSSSIGGTDTNTSDSQRMDSRSRGDAAMAQLLPTYTGIFFLEPRPLMVSLLTFPQWKWTNEHLKQLVQCMPNLRELGLATELPPIDVIRYLSAHLPKLKMLRLLNAPPLNEVSTSIESVTEWYENWIGAAVRSRKKTALRWIGVGELYFEVLEDQERDLNLDGEPRKARNVRRVPMSKISVLPIWSTDVLEI